MVGVRFRAPGYNVKDLAIRNQCLGFAACGVQAFWWLKFKVQAVSSGT